MRKKQGIILIIFILFSNFWGAIVQADASVDHSTFTVQASAALAVDADSGKVLYAQNADEPVGIASITKIISLYLVEKNIEQGNLDWQDLVTISPEVAQLSVVPELSNVELTAGNSYTVKELFDAAAIQSANAAVVALAEKIAGSEKNFVDLMKKQLESWGIHDAFLVNSSGLNNEDLVGDLYPGSTKTDENILSAKDIAVVARHLIQDYPDYLAISATPSKVFGEGTPNQTILYNTNWMLAGSPYEESGTLGLKTGTTDFAGACFVGFFEQDGHHFLTVILNAENGTKDPSTRFSETKRLLEYVSSNWQFETLNLNQDSSPKLEDLPVIYGKTSFVSIATKEPVKIWLPTKTSKKTLTYQLALEENIVNQHQKLLAPLSMNQVIGTLSLTIPNDPFGYLESTDEKKNAVPVIVTTPVEKANFFIRAIQSFLELFK